MCLKNKLTLGKKRRNNAYVLLTDLWPDILVIVKDFFFVMHTTFLDFVFWFIMEFRVLASVLSSFSLLVLSVTAETSHRSVSFVSFSYQNPCRKHLVSLKEF